MPRFWPFRRAAQPATSAPAGGRQRRLFGREYTADVPYALPSDLGEMNRLDFQHYLLRQAFKGIYAAPIGAPRDILDVGAGTGRWAKEMAAHVRRTAPGPVLGHPVRAGAGRRS